MIHTPICNIYYSFQPRILELEPLFDALAPSVLVVKVHIGAFFIVGSDAGWLLVSLEPREILLVVSPRELLQSLRRIVLLYRSLLVVENVEQGVQIHLGINGWVVKHRRNLAREGFRWYAWIDGRVSRW